MVPLLFIAGVVFSLLRRRPGGDQVPAELQPDQFNIQVRASDYYGFFITTLLALGLVFQVPMGILAVTRLGIVTPSSSRQNRRYAYLSSRSSRCCFRGPTR